MKEIDVSPIHQKSGNFPEKFWGKTKTSRNLFVSLPPNNLKTPKRPFITTKVSPKFPQSVKRGTKLAFFELSQKFSFRKKNKVERKNKFEEKKTKSLISKVPNGHDDLKKSICLMISGHMLVLFKNSHFVTMVRSCHEPQLDTKMVGNITKDCNPNCFSHCRWQKKKPNGGDFTWKQALEVQFDYFLNDFSG